MANNIDDKWLIVYQGTWNNYDKDSNKDSYKNKLVLVTGNKDSDTEIDQTPYLCVDNDTQSVKIPIPVIYLRGISIGKNTYGFTDSVLAFAKANGIDISYKSGAVTIGIDNDTLTKINSIDSKVEQTTYENKVAELEGAIESKYTKPAGGIPVKDLVGEVATETEVINAISKASEAIDTKIGNKVDKETYNTKVAELVSDIEDKISKTDTIPAESIVPLSVGKSGIVGNTPIIANRIPYLKADAFAFLQPEDFTVEVAYDGSTWETLDNNNADMRGMFAQLNYGTGFPIDGSNTNWQVGSKIRITLSPQAVRNAKIDFVVLNIFANGRIFDILTEYYDNSSGKEGWHSVGDPLTISSNGIAFIKYNQYFSFAGYARGGARFTFTITYNTQHGSRIVGISGYGNLSSEITPTSSTAPYTLGTLWYWDYLKNVYFPNDIYEGGTPLKNKYASITSVIQDIESANEDYITISTKGGTTVPTKVIGANTALIAGSENGLATAQDVRASIPETLPNPNALEISLNGLPVKTYDGSSTYKLSFYAPTKVGSKGQVFKSIDGIMVDWGNVDWSEIKNKPDVINFANDLTGVLEATPEEFTFRPSAGDKSIRDESAVIRRIKGNTTVWEQRVHNANFSEGKGWWGSGNGTITIDPTDGSAKLTHNSNSSVSITQDSIRTIPAGHKTLFIVDYKRGVTKSDRSLLYYKRANVSGYDMAMIDNIASDERRVDAFFLTTTDDTHLFLFYPCLNAPTGTVSTIYKAQLFDLTNLFGAGNEPTTLEAFREVYPDDYYPYSEPEIRNMRATAIETIGFNQWDEEWENGSFNITTGENIINTQIRCKNLIRVLPNTHYSLSIGNIYMGIWAMFYDENNSILEPVNINSSVAGKCLYVSPSDNRNIFVTPANAAWMKFYLTAEYGTSYNNDICINLSHSGVRNGEYHPYKMSIFVLPEVLNYFPEGMNGIGEVYDEINSENAIQRCGIRRYTNGDENNDDVRTDKKNTVYILAEPIVKPILEPIQLAYDVEDFGTEKALAAPKSSPFRADIVYQFNAEGRIRDNGRNIAKLETKINTLDRAITVANGRFDGGYVKAEGIIDAAENLYLLPSSSSTEKDKRLANEQYVIDSLPREVAQAVERIVGSSIPQHLFPNIIYEATGSILELKIVSLNGQEDSYDDVWRVRCGLDGNATIDIFPTRVLWENGIAPNPTEWGIYEFEFRKTQSLDNRILGRWRVYK